jgi:DNA polymerase (family 10)
VAVFDAAARAGTALEINSFPDRLDLNDELARLAQDHGVVLAISTDAHATRHLDNIRYGVATAQRAWIRPENVINTWPVGRLRAFLAKGRRP